MEEICFITQYILFPVSLFMKGLMVAHTAETRSRE
jgi:hypothetical protein